MSEDIDFFENNNVREGRLGLCAQVADAGELLESDFPNGGKERRARDLRVERGVRGEFSPDDGKGTGALISGLLRGSGSVKSTTGSSGVLPASFFASDTG